MGWLILLKGCRSSAGGVDLMGACPGPKDFIFNNECLNPHISNFLFRLNLVHRWLRAISFNALFGLRVGSIHCNVSVVS